eukprot:355377-Chlamydomonas_euryale.AAC.2
MEAFPKVEGVAGGTADTRQPCCAHKHEFIFEQNAPGNVSRAALTNAQLRANRALLLPPLVWIGDRPIHKCGRALGLRLRKAANAGARYVARTRDPVRHRSAPHPPSLPPSLTPYLPPDARVMSARRRLRVGAIAGNVAPVTDVARPPAVGRVPAGSPVVGSASCSPASEPADPTAARCAPRGIRERTRHRGGMEDRGVDDLLAELLGGDEPGGAEDAERVSGGAGGELGAEQESSALDGLLGELQAADASASGASMQQRAHACTPAARPKAKI